MQRLFDLSQRFGFAPCALLAADTEPRIEARIEEQHDRRRDGGMLAQRRPHVILRIGDADLAQETRDGADEHNVSPHQSGNQHQGVVAVVLRDAAHHHQEQRFQPFACVAQLNRPAVRTFQQHVVEPDLRSAIAFGRDLIGALIDNAEAHIFQYRHARRQRDRPALAPHFQADAVGAAVEIHVERPL